MNPYCSHCGFLLEPDCDFCPSCGSAKATSQHSSSNARDPHVWMKDSPPPQAQPLPQPRHSASLAQPVPSAPLPQPAAQIQYVTYEVHGPTTQGVRDSGLGVTVRTMGIIALSFMLIGFIPCLGWLNYLNLALSFITIVIGVVAIVSAKSDADRTSALLGLAFVVLAIILGTGRLIIGGGCL